MIRILFLWVVCSNYSTVQPPDGEVCSLPMDPGPCDGACPRFFFNACTGQCEDFIYGCCLGNANNFVTLAECEATCPPAGNICYLAADVGPCDGICPRYFFNACTGQCEVFQYGCCGGNANNFMTLEECEEACPAFCTGDLNGDSMVHPSDLAMLLGSWGFCPNCELIVCPADLNGDCFVDAADLAMLLGNWGSCQ